MRHSFQHANAEKDKRGRRRRLEQKNKVLTLLKGTAEKHEKKRFRETRRSRYRLY